MSFDITALNDASLSVADDVLWNGNPLQVVMNLQPDTENSDGYEMTHAERVTAETKASLITAMVRGDSIVFDGNTFKVLGWVPVDVDWARIELEKA